MDKAISLLWMDVFWFSCSYFDYCWACIGYHYRLQPRPTISKRHSISFLWGTKLETFAYKRQTDARCWFRTYILVYANILLNVYHHSYTIRTRVYLLWSSYCLLYFSFCIIIIIIIIIILSAKDLEEASEWSFRIYRIWLYLISLSLSLSLSSIYSIRYISSAHNWFCFLGFPFLRARRFVKETWILGGHNLNVWFFSIPSDFRIAAAPPPFVRCAVMISTRRSTPTRCSWKTLFSCWAQRALKPRNSPKRCSTSRSALPSWRQTRRILSILSRAYRSWTWPIYSVNRFRYRLSISPIPAAVDCAIFLISFGSQIPWLEILRAIYPTTVFDDSTELLITSPDYLKDISSIVSSSDRRYSRLLQQ